MADSVRSYCLQGAIGWLVLGVVVGGVLSIMEGPYAWWTALAVTPMVSGYSIAAAVNWDSDD